MNPSRYVAVCGASDPDPSQRELAREVGRPLVRRGDARVALDRAPTAQGGRRKRRPYKRVVEKADGRYLILYSRAPKSRSE